MSLYQYVYHALIKYKKLKSLTFNRDANDLWQWIPLKSLSENQKLELFTK